TWEICVPAQLVADAENLFQSDDTFTRLEPKRPAPASRIHTYSRFGTVGSNHEFVIVPDCDVHMDCCSDIIVRSPRGLLYPSLKAFAQSCIDRRNQLELSDLIDGIDVSEEWGEEHLDLNGVHNVSWALGMQEKDSGSSMPIGWPTLVISAKIAGETAVAFASVGNGKLGYIGGVNAEEGSNAVVLRSNLPKFDAKLSHIQLG
ncbi:hypothetical protein C2857_000131, partial [Epichloe festucae Fl1]